MTTNMTAQQCKQELENILKDAVENGNFNYKVEVSTKNYYKEGYVGSGCVEIAIKGKENETKEIFVGTDYTALDNEDVRIAMVYVEDLLYWNRSCWRLDSENNNKEGEYHLYKDNYLITQLIIAQRLQIAKRATTIREKKYYLKKYSSKDDFEGYTDDTEFYVFVDNSKYNHWCRKTTNIGVLIYDVYSNNQQKAYAQDGVELNYCIYFKVTVGEIKKMFNK